MFLRDPLNLCASLIRRKALPWLEIVAILRQLFAERDWLMIHARQEVPTLQLIPYSAWLNDNTYRRRIAEAFDLRSSTSPARGFGLWPRQLIQSVNQIAWSRGRQPDHSLAYLPR